MLRLLDPIEKHRAFVVVSGTLQQHPALLEHGIELGEAAGPFRAAPGCLWVVRHDLDLAGQEFTEGCAPLRYGSTRIRTGDARLAALASPSLGTLYGPVGYRPPAA